eukprot:COSAG05_NODE_18855_length_301_cov_1.277228_1_plen_26_part_01
MPAVQPSRSQVGLLMPKKQRRCYCCH